MPFEQAVKLLSSTPRGAIKKIPRWNFHFRARENEGWHERLPATLWDR